ncbi:MAG: DNA polymerase beta domain-containing protein [Bacteroidetes bacterium OLB12]|nr:MAG: DNA polymerase beta domain-containing protein [Bacteroidetes bacterium OLB12]
MITNQQQQVIIDHLRPLRPYRIGVFGSFARGDNKQDSDLDILVALDYSLKPSLLDLVAIEQALTSALGIQVDLVTEKIFAPLY